MSFVLKDLQNAFGYSKEVVEETVGGVKFTFRIPGSEDFRFLRAYVQSTGTLLDFDRLVGAMSVAAINDTPLFTVVGVDLEKLGYKTPPANPLYPPLDIRFPAFRRFVEEITKGESINPNLAGALALVYRVDIAPRLNLDVPALDNRIRYVCTASDCAKDQFILRIREEGYHCRYCGKPVRAVEVAEVGQEVDPFAESETTPT